MMQGQISYSLNVKIEKDINVFIYHSFVLNLISFSKTLIILLGTLKNSPFPLKFDYIFIDLYIKY